MKIYILKAIATLYGENVIRALYFAGEAKSKRLSGRHRFAASQKNAVRFPSKKQAEAQAEAIGNVWVVRLKARRAESPRASADNCQASA